MAETDGIFIKNSGNWKKVANLGSSVTSGGVALYNVNVGCFTTGTAEPTTIRIIKSNNIYNWKIHGGAYMPNGSDSWVNPTSGNWTSNSVSHELLGQGKSTPTIILSDNKNRFTNILHSHGICWSDNLGFTPTVYNVTSSTMYFQGYITGDGNMNLDAADSVTLAQHFGITLPA